MSHMKRLLDENPHGICEAYIVSQETALNSMKGLLTALEQLMEWEGNEAGFYPEDDTQQRANEVWQDAFDAVAKARGE